MTTNQEQMHVAVVLSLEEAKAILQSCVRGGTTDSWIGSRELDWYKDKKQYGSGLDSSRGSRVTVYPQGMYAGCEMPIPYATFVGEEAKVLKEVGLNGRWDRT